MFKYKAVLVYRLRNLRTYRVDMITWPLIKFYLASEQTNTKEGMPLFTELQLKNMNYVPKVYKIKWSLVRYKNMFLNLCLLLFFNKSSFSWYTDAVSGLLLAHVFGFCFPLSLYL